MYLQSISIVSCKWLNITTSSTERRSECYVVSVLLLLFTSAFLSLERFLKIKYTSPHILAINLQYLTFLISEIIPGAISIVIHPFLDQERGKKKREKLSQWNVLGLGLIIITTFFSEYDPPRNSAQ